MATGYLSPDMWPDPGSLGQGSERSMGGGLESPARGQRRPAERRHTSAVCAGQRPAFLPGGRCTRFQCQVNVLGGKHKEPFRISGQWGQPRFSGASDPVRILRGHRSRAAGRGLGPGRGGLPRRVRGRACFGSPGKGPLLGEGLWGSGKAGRPGWRGSSRREGKRCALSPPGGPLAPMPLVALGPPNRTTARRVRS